VINYGAVPIFSPTNSIQAQFYVHSSLEKTLMPDSSTVMKILFIFMCLFFYCFTVGDFIGKCVKWFVGAPRVAQATARLPLSLVLRPCMPVKNATYKITIDTNKSPVNLGDLFSGQFFWC